MADFKTHKEGTDLTAKTGVVTALGMGVQFEKLAHRPFSTTPACAELRRRQA
jgi:hypothetical protein